jgi:hypothetical protein
VQVLEAGQVLVHRRVLPGQPDPLADLRGGATHVDACHLGGAVVGLEQGREHPDRGGLAGAVRTQQTEHGAFGDGEVEPVQRAQGAVGLYQSPRPDDVSHRGSP